ncbi:hypothetical protein SDJN02_07891, partial [Cucurbita argyrosperma subsp. argyrosperma]
MYIGVAPILLCIGISENSLIHDIMPFYLSFNFMTISTVSFMFSRSLKFPAKESTSKKDIHFPYLISSKPQTISDHGSRRVYLELSLGSLEEVWVTVLNVTGPLSNWSFADNKLPAPEILAGGPPSYICRLSGASHENWRFWLEVQTTNSYYSSQFHSN